MPSPWQLLPEATLPAYGAVWYRRTLHIAPTQPPSEEAGETHVLVFEAASHTARVWVDGVCCGGTLNGNLPFEIALGRLSPGDHELLVRVELPDDDEGGEKDPRFGEIPHGKQSWYGPVGGLWRSVSLETRPEAHLVSVRCRTDPQREHVRVRLARSPVPCGALEVAVTDAAGIVVATQTLERPDVREEVVLPVPDPARWSPEHPATYRVAVRLRGTQGTPVDELGQCVGFREIGVRGTDIVLDGHPLRVRGVLDQDYWPVGDWTPPDDDQVAAQLGWAKEAGFNLLRYHIKIPTHRYLDLADQLGLMVWLELPNWRDFTEHAADAGRELLEAMVDAFGHHPSVAVFSVVNESWGVDLADSWQRQWVIDAVDWLRGRPEGWLVVDNSPCEPNGHLDTDLEDYHFYASLPDHRARWDGFLEAFTSGRWPTYEGQRQEPRRPLVLSEFGFWSLPLPPPDDAIANPRAQRGPSWGNDIAEPAGMLDRFGELSLDLVFDDYEQLAIASQRLQSQALRYSVASLRRAGLDYVVTELTDVYWEVNGVLDPWRRPKQALADFTDVNGTTAVLLVPRRAAYWAGERVEVDLATDGAPPGSRVELETISPLGRQPWASLEDVRVPQVSSATEVRVQARMLSAGNETLAADHLILAVFPRPRERPPTEQMLQTVDPAIGQALHAQGWTFGGRLASDGVWWVQRVDDAVLDRLRAGGTVVLVATAIDALGPLSWSFPPARLVSTSGFDSNWMLRTSWIRRDGAFAHIPGGPIVGWDFDGMIPDLGLAGIFPSEFRHRVHAGSAMGWLHHPVATICTRQVGRGTLVVCTWPVADPGAGSPPARGAVLDGLVRVALGAHGGETA